MHGRKFIGCEVDPTAFEIACERIENAQRQTTLFEAPKPYRQQDAFDEVSRAEFDKRTKA